MVPLAAPQGKSNRRLTAGSEECSLAKLPNVVVNSVVDLPPLRQDLPDEHNTIEISEIVCRERLGGLIKPLERVAA